MGVSLVANPDPQACNQTGWGILAGLRILVSGGVSCTLLINGQRIMDANVNLHFSLCVWMGN